MTKTLDDIVLSVLRKCVCEGNLVRMPQLDRPTYVKVNKALEALGGKWRRQRGGHEFADDAAELITGAVMTGEVTDFKKLYQFFETPKPLAARMVSMAGIDGRELQAKVLEPSAGRGAILNELGNFACVIHCHELDPKNRAYLLNEWGDSITLRPEPDFLDAIPNPIYDAVVMNPPFRAGQDCLHVMHAFEFVKMGGCLVAITSPGWQFRDTKPFNNFRDWVFENGGEIEDLPPGTFAASGTEIRTVLIRIVK